MNAIGVQRWATLMGKELAAAGAQPLQRARVSRGKLRIDARSLGALGFTDGDRLDLQVRRGVSCLQRSARTGAAIKAGRPLTLPVPERAARTMCPDDSPGALLVAGRGRPKLLPVEVREHPSDVLGPRFIDELREDRVVRHVVPGLPHDAWTAEAAREIEGLVCSEPFGADPVSAISDGDDWVAWMTRNRVLARPAPRDDHLQARLVAEIAGEQRKDGSWRTVPATAYAVLRLLALGTRPSDASIRQATRWLLELPEPPPRPGMWMLTSQDLADWMSRRTPSEGHAVEACETIGTPPDEDVNFFSWSFPESEQDEFRAQELQQVIPTCARHHPPACEPRITHVSALVAETLLRCGYADHPRLRRYVNTVSHLGGKWGYWCGCGALGLYDQDLPACEDPFDFDVRRSAPDGRSDLPPWRWVDAASKSALLANNSRLPDRGTHLEPFTWQQIPGEENQFALVGSAWQNGDCWAKTNRALSQHPSCPGSLTERLAIYQASRYQTPLGEWDQGFPAGMLAFLALYDSPAARALVIKTVPWLRENQGEDGLWHHEGLPRIPWGKLATPPEPRLATYHIVSALHAFGLLARLRP